MLKSKVNLKRIVDVLLILSFLFLLEFPLKREVLHEIGGVVFAILVIVHIYLNRKWFLGIFKRKGIYNVLLAVVNVLLILVLILQLLSGISVSGELFKFISFGSLEMMRRIHLALSYWFFVLLGIHFGLNWSAFIPANLSARIKRSKLRPYLMTLFFALALYGAFVFQGAGIASYMFGAKAYPDYGYYQYPLLVLINNISILTLWVFISSQIANFLKR